MINKNSGNIPEYPTDHDNKRQNTGSNGLKNKKTDNKQKQEKQKKERMMSPFFRFAYYVLGFICRICGFKVYGKDNIPPKGKTLLAANHSSLCDPILVALAFPYQVHFLAKEEFAHSKFLERLFSALGVIFIKRNSPDLVALRRAISVLKEGKTVGIFPEGYRNTNEGLADFKQGSIFIARQAKANIIPIGLVNAGDLFKFWRRKVEIHIGKPIVLDDTDGQGGKLATSEIMDKYTEAVTIEITKLAKIK